MAVLPPSLQSLVRPASSPRLWRQLLWRSPLVVLSVFVCYQFSWTSLRYVTSEAALLTAKLFGLAAYRTGYNSIVVGSDHIHFTISCTFVDLYFGSLPLLWRTSFRPFEYFRLIMVFAAVLFGLNQVRIAITYLAFRCGMGWLMADILFGGLLYFAVWQWLSHSLAGARDFRSDRPALITS